MWPGRATRLAWLETLTIEPPFPSRIIDRVIGLLYRARPFRAENGGPVARRRRFSLVL